jgi:hypothetical protein
MLRLLYPPSTLSRFQELLLSSVEKSSTSQDQNRMENIDPGTAKCLFWEPINCHVIET